MLRIKRIACICVAVAVPFVVLTGCAELIGAAITHAAETKPASLTERVAFSSQADAVTAAIQVATDQGWVVKTVDKSSGYLEAERQIRSSSGVYVYTLTVNVGSDNNVTVKASPPPGFIVSDKDDPKAIDRAFIDALKQKLS